MGRKPIPEYKIQQIILMSAQGETQAAIMEATDTTKPTVIRYQTKYKEAIEAKREELDIPPPPETPKGGNIPIDTENENNTDKKKKEKPDPILTAATGKFITGSSETMSKEMVRRFNDAMKGGLMLLDAQMKYMKSLDEMGVTWDKFVDFSLKLGYDEIEEAYIQELERERILDRDVALQVEEGLHQEEIEELENNQDKLMKRLLRVEEV